jgi:hypothetical protein
MENWILRMARRPYIRILSAWGLASFGLVLFALSQQRYIHNFLKGPFEMSSTELASIGRARIDITKNSRYFARVVGTEAFDTGIEKISVEERNGVETSRSTAAKYYALLIGDKFLIVETETEMPLNAEGELLPLPIDLEHKIFGTEKEQAYRQNLYPFYLTKGSFRTRGYIAIAASLIFTFFLIKVSLPKWKYLQNPLTIPVIKRVTAWGDIYSISADIEHEFRNPQLYGVNNWTLTDKYLIKPSFFYFNVFRITDLLWAYKRVTKHSVNFIPTGKTFKAVLLCYGGTASIEGDENRADVILQFVAKRAPWAFLGYSPEIANLANMDMKQLCLEVEKRKQVSLSGVRPG